jgi:hypothetical protein
MLAVAAHHETFRDPGGQRRGATAKGTKQGAPGAMGGAALDNLQHVHPATLQVYLQTVNKHTCDRRDLVRCMAELRLRIG